MRLHIDKHRPPGNTLRGILEADLEPAVEELDRPGPESLEKVVHDVRRRVKKMRAALRLFRVADHPGITRQDHIPLRDASRKIAAIRDAAVNLRTMRKLCGHFDIAPVQHTAIFQFLEHQRAQAERDPAVPLCGASVLLHKADRKIKKKTGIRLKSRELRDGLARIYKRARKAFQKAVKELSEKNLHRWRKRTKDVLYDLLLAQSDHPKAVRKLARQTGNLGELLGEEHDLALLQQTLLRSGINTAAVEPLIAVRRLKLQGKILKSGKALFARKPEDFIRQFAR